jgi:small glutamine-rich tetratricopeptide repeat-containing protein alpha
MKVSDNDAAVKDCQEAIRLDPNFSKAYRRLGAAYTAMKSTDLAIEAYKECLQIDPADASAKSSLEALLKAPSASSPRPASGGPSGSPFGAGGMPDLGAMLNNPELMKMAQQMMNSGALNNMMKDPNMMNMMQSMMGGMGGGPAAANEIEEEE